jgi:hypothetical protein
MVVMVVHVRPARLRFEVGVDEVPVSVGGWFGLGLGGWMVGLGGWLWLGGWMVE